MVKTMNMDDLAREVLKDCPRKGWGVLRCQLPTAIMLVEAGYVKGQYTHLPGVYQVRLKGKGRRLFE